MSVNLILEGVGIEPHGRFFLRSQLESVKKNFSDPLDDNPPCANFGPYLLWDHRLSARWYMDEANNSKEIDRKAIYVNISEDDLDEIISLPEDPAEMYACQILEWQIIYEYTWENESSFSPDKLILNIKRLDSIFGLNDLLVVVGASFNGEYQEWLDMEYDKELDWYEELFILKS
jgi:hypothetical protein